MTDDKGLFGDPRLPQRFWDKVVVRESGCWEWTASTSKTSGYGWYKVGGKSQNAHRESCIAFHGEPSPRSLFAMHSCDNPPCVNPAHLKWGTPADNQRDMAAKGRGRKAVNLSHCPQGHEFSEDNTYLTKAGTKTCRTCYRKKWREWDERRKSPQYETSRTPTHGTETEYGWGCRCDECREAKRLSQQRRRAMRKGGLE